MKLSPSAYFDFSLEDWISDPDFQTYVFHPDPVSIHQWKLLFENYPDLKPISEEARSILISLNQPSFSLENNEVMGIWSGIQKEIHTAPTKLHFSSRLNWRIKVAAAGMVAVLVFAGIWWVEKPIKYIEHSTGNGETISFYLPDSSEVILNANSSLTYPAEWGAEKIRKVTLHGEAYFNIRHLEDHRPFQVVPNQGLEIQVLGTSFNVYERNKETRVVLSEGKVSLKFPKSNLRHIEMSPGDLVSISPEKISRKQVDTDAYTSWTRRMLILNETSLSEIIRVAEETFGFRVVVDESVSVNQTASGSIPLENGDEFMSLISKVFNFNFEKKDSIYYIQ
ncbi:FecR family protein [Algoriphagus confluentis]|uniref:DUF4974 domain-containing protein n=1 Tax=Algoriphagus confluentis TaxID=1697556 RepID=A0ABQ6PPY7_9BACT|nr:hypothetical protein Aconfl_19530 [Algoriphagus confluentis]